MELLLAGTIEDLPDYSWYKENALSHITGVFNKTSTVINETNYTDIEKANLHDLSNFVFQGRKEFSVGMIKVNIHALDNKSVKISGHTLKNADVCFIFTEWPEIKSLAPEKFKTLMKKALVFDGRNIWSPKQMNEQGVEYYSIGR